MARELRVEFLGAIYRVMNRGDGRWRMDARGHKNHKHEPAISRILRHFVAMGSVVGSGTRPRTS